MVEDSKPSDDYYILALRDWRSPKMGVQDETKQCIHWGHDTHEHNL